MNRICKNKSKILNIYPYSKETGEAGELLLLQKEIESQPFTLATLSRCPLGTD